MDLTPYLKLMVKKNASDLFVTVGAPIKVKLDGNAMPVGRTILTSELAKETAYEVMTEEQIEQFKKNLELDFAIALEGDSARFRVNAFMQRGNVSMVLRLIPGSIPTVEQLGLPEVLKTMILHKRGLILMVGATGSGKSTTLAAMLNHRNENMSGHILTIEDPVEFSHKNLKSVVNQREVGIDTRSYANALKSSLREAPDVILVGEIRARDTMEAVMELSSTGHLAVSTLHANNANQAIERVINLFPEEMHKQLFMDLSLNIRAIVSQRLVRGVDGKRCAALEILVNTPHIAELILNGEIYKLKAAMESSGQKGMQTFDAALYNLYKEERIELEEAFANADSRTDLEAKINFG